nr:putative E3 ubiquitin-protein ligase RF4 [Ipomoea batatas]
MFGAKDIPALSSSMMKSYELLDEKLHNALNELRSLSQKYDPSFNNANKKINWKMCSFSTKNICSMFNKANCEISQLVVWDDPMAVELEKLLIPHIKVLPTIQSRRSSVSSSGVPVSERDGMIVSLMQRKQQLQKEALRQHEEREKIMLLEKAESIRRERQERKQKTKMEGCVN